MNQPKLSLILVIDHNQENYRRVLEQVQAQDYLNLEIIVVSNRVNSKDQIILDFLVYKDELKRSTHLSFVNRDCLSSLYNEGISCATGEYIWCIDENVIFNDTRDITNILQTLVHSKAQAIYLQDSNELGESKAPSLDKPEKYYSLEHPISLINQRDWHNYSRIIINLASLRLFGLHFSDTSSRLNGALFSMQIIRFLPNIYYYAQKLITFKNRYLSQNPREFIEHTLALNYNSRYSEILFGAHSNTFKSILKREIKDTQSIYKLVTLSQLNSKAKDFIKYSRINCLSNYINKAFNGHQEQFELLSKIESLTGDIKSTPDEMLNELFKYSKIKVHCGAHKTATTYIQNILFEARYDLALQNTIFIHHDQLRDDFMKAKQENGITDTEKRLAFAICKQAALLTFGIPSMLIISEENLIRPSTDIFTKWLSEDTYQYASNYSCACIRNGYNTDHLVKINNIFKGGIEIIYTVRNYFDYLLSRHSEFLKWRPFREFDGDFIGINDLKKCNWKYLIADLKKISSLTSILCFESYKSNPLGFANYLSEFDLSSYEKKVKRNQKTSRSRASQSLLDDLINKSHIGFNKDTLKEIFVKGIDSETSKKPKFKSKLFSPRNLRESSDSYENKYLSKDFQFSSKDYTSLPNQNSSESNILRRLPLPERQQLSLCRNSKELELSLSSVAQRSLYLDNRIKFIPKQPGVSAMIRIKNEEDNIYNVLISIRNCFDEIVVIDNNSSDNTISEINRAVNDHPILEAKLKLHHYKFAIARCGLDNFKEQQNSPHSLASFYNYSLKKCNYSKVCKWDGDMLLPISMEKSFQNFLELFTKGEPSRKDSTVFGVMKGLTVYKGSNGKLYCRHLAFEKEARIFENCPGVFFIKEILWEQLFSLHSVERLVSEDLTFVEFKDTSVNEFSHWTADASLGMSPRKDKELRDFNLIKKITQNDSKEYVDQKILSEGFKEIDFNLFDFIGTPPMIDSNNSVEVN